jgi:hypothetical protein
MTSYKLNEPQDELDSPRHTSYSDALALARFVLSHSCFLRICQLLESLGPSTNQVHVMVHLCVQADAYRQTQGLATGRTRRHER